MEYTFNNSVLRTFTKLLQDTVKGRTKPVGGGRVRTGLFESTSIQRDPQRAGSASSEENEGLEFTLLSSPSLLLFRLLPFPLLTAVAMFSNVASFPASHTPNFGHSILQEINAGGRG